jgi:ATP-dependent RNA helicase DHX37/DHR1
MLVTHTVDDEKEPPVQPPRSVPSLGKTRHRPLPRAADIEAARAELPIIAMEQEIMSIIDEHDVVLLCGATGCGKTTQVPQFLLEAGFGCRQFAERAGMIGVTQPRRVAAVSTARRVAQEVGDPAQKAGLVGYQVRYDREVGSEAAVKFMTDGILMRELQDDFLLTKYDSSVDLCL